MTSHVHSYALLTINFKRGAKKESTNILAHTCPENSKHKDFYFVRNNKVFSGSINNNVTSMAEVCEVTLRVFLIEIEQLGKIEDVEIIIQTPEKTFTFNEVMSWQFSRFRQGLAHDIYQVLNGKILKTASFLPIGIQVKDTKVHPEMMCRHQEFYELRFNVAMEQIKSLLEAPVEKIIRPFIEFGGAPADLKVYYIMDIEDSVWNTLGFVPETQEIKPVPELPGLADEITEMELKYRDHIKQIVVNNALLPKGVVSYKFHFGLRGDNGIYSF